MPALLRPIASYMTTAANTSDSANSGEVKPSLRESATVSEHTSAEWELGIPPAPTIRSQTNSFVSKKLISVLSTCAISHAKKATSI